MKHDNKAVELLVVPMPAPVALDIEKIKVMSGNLQIRHMTIKIPFGFKTSISYMN